MKPLLLTLALLTTTAQAAFISRDLHGSATETTFGGNAFAGSFDSANGPSGFTGSFEIPPPVTDYLFRWMPSDNAGAIKFNIYNQVTGLYQEYHIGVTGETHFSSIVPGTYDFELIGTGGRAGAFTWTIIPRGVPDGGDFFLCGWVGLLGAMIAFKRSLTPLP